MDLSRRGLMGAFICAPAIVRASSLMPIKVLESCPELLAISTFEVFQNTAPMIMLGLVENMNKNNAFLRKLQSRGTIWKGETIWL